MHESCKPALTMRLGGFAIFVFSLFALTSAGCTAFNDLSASEPASLSGGGDDAGPVPPPPPPPPVDGGVNRGAGDGSGSPLACQDAVSQGANAYLTVEDAAKVCAVLPTCDPAVPLSITYSLGVSFGPGDFSSCMQSLAGSIPTSRIGVHEQQTMLQCLVGKSCTDALGCLPYEVLGKGDTRCNGKGTSVFCGDPNTLVDCGAMAVSHCEQPLFGQGATCLTGTGTDSTGASITTSECALGTCSCDSSGCNSPTACVNGNTEEICDKNVFSISYDCSLSGYTCVEQDSTGNVGLNCASQDTQVLTCSALGETQCAGNVLEVCDGFQFSEFDCGAEGGTCSSEGGPAHCVRAADKCDFYSQGINGCAGSNVTLCIDGAPGCFDCASIGMRCAADPTSGLARCTN